MIPVCDVIANIFKHQELFNFHFKSIIKHVGRLQAFCIFDSFRALKFYILYVCFSVADLPIQNDAVTSRNQNSKLVPRMRSL